MNARGALAARAAAVLLAMSLTTAPAEASGRNTGRHGDGLSSKDVVYEVAGGRALRVGIHRNLAVLPSPVLVHVHGGGWSRGTRPPRAAFAAAMAMGFSVVTVEYRLATEAKAPAAVLDVRCALAWIGRHAGDHGFNASRIVVEGESAGAHLALLAVLAGDAAGFDADCGPLPRVAALVDRFGIVDLQAWHPPSGAVERWLGPRADFEDYTARLSPLRYVGRDMPPLFIVHGDADKVVPISQSRGLYDAVRALGVPVAFHVVPGGGHGRFTEEQKASIDAGLCLFLHENGVLLRSVFPRNGRPARSPDPCKGGDP